MRSRSRALMTMTLAAALALPALARAQAANGSCKPVFDAMLKETMTPHHAVTMKDGALQGEVISTADAQYVKVDGKWRKSPLSPKNQLAMQQENIRDVTVASCKALGGEVVDGKPATVYQAHYEQKDMGASDAKIWIANGTGLPIRTDSSLAAGEKMSMSTHYDYDHITAPIVK